MLTPDQMEQVGRESDEAFSAFELALLCAAAYALIRSRGSVGTVAGLRARLNAISARYSGTLQAAVRNDYSAAYAASFAEDAASAGQSVRVALSFSSAKPDAAAAAAQAAERVALQSARAFDVAEIQRKMVESCANDYVRRVAANASGLARTGVGYNAAIGEAVSAMAAEGVTAFEYVRRDGVAVRVPADVYVRQRVRTEVNRKCVDQTLRTARAAGLLVEVSTHAGCRPSHAPWEGGLYQLEGEGPHRNFYRATMYVGGPYADWVEGLGGYNCYHQSRCCHGEHDRRYGKDPLEGTGYTNEQAYELRARQRAMENDIRKLKRQKEVLDANGLDSTAVTRRLNAKRTELQRHVDAHPKILRRDSQRWREQEFASARGAKDSFGIVHLDAAAREDVAGRIMLKTFTADEAVLSEGIVMPNGGKSRFITYSEVEPTVVFAGYGSSIGKELRVRQRLTDEYSEGKADPKLWSHVSGEGWMFDPLDDGRIKRGEVHWMEHPDVGRKEFYFKNWAKGYREEG